MSDNRTGNDDICSLCGVDTTKEYHKHDCPYIGLGRIESITQRFFSTGWKCPLCGRVYSPSTPECQLCNSKIGKTDEKTVEP